MADPNRITHDNPEPGDVSPGCPGGAPGPCDMTDATMAAVPDEAMSTRGGEACGAECGSRPDGRADGRGGRRGRRPGATVGTLGPEIPKPGSGPCLPTDLPGRHAHRSRPGRRHRRDVRGRNLDPRGREGGRQARGGVAPEGPDLAPARRGRRGGGRASGRGPVGHAPRPPVPGRRPRGVPRLRTRALGGLYCRHRRRRRRAQAPRGPRVRERRGPCLLARPPAGLRGTRRVRRARQGRHQRGPAPAPAPSCPPSSGSPTPRSCAPPATGPQAGRPPRAGRLPRARGRRGRSARVSVAPARAAHQDPDQQRAGAHEPRAQAQDQGRPGVPVDGVRAAPARSASQARQTPTGPRITCSCRGSP